HGRADRPGRRPRPVRPAGLAVPGVSDTGVRDLARPARTPGRAGCLVRAAPSAAGCGSGDGGARLAAGGLARRHRRGGRRGGWAGRAADGLAALVRPAGVRPGTQPVAVVVLPAALARRDDHRPAGSAVPGPRRRPAARQGHRHRGPRCRGRTGGPGVVVLERVRRAALAEPMAALPIPEVTDLRALPVGRREDGSPFAVRLQGTHLLIAGATGAGKGSYLWGLVRALLPAMAAGLVRVRACDPKLMELAFGRELFDRYGRYAAD